MDRADPAVMMFPIIVRTKTESSALRTLLVKGETLVRMRSKSPALSNTPTTPSRSIVNMMMGSIPLTPL